MKTRYPYLVLLIMCLSIIESVAQPYHYPTTPTCDTVDSYFGVKVADPYRWLENEKSPATLAWIQSENDFTRQYFDTIPFREAIRKNLTEMWNYPKESVPVKAGNFYLYLKNNGIQNQSVLYKKNLLTGKETLLLDPNALSKNGTIALNTWAVSNDNRYLAYALASGGSDWTEIRVMTLDGKPLPDLLKWVKFSSVAWFQNGFFYSRYDAPAGNALNQRNTFQKIYYHQLGTTQDSDRLIYGDPEHPLRTFSVQTTDDERFMFIYGADGTSGNNLLVGDLRKGIHTPLHQLVSGFEHNYFVIDDLNNDLIIRTNDQAPNYCLIKVNTTNWEKSLLVPENNDVLQQAVILDHKMVLLYLHNAYNQLSLYDVNGAFIKKISLPSMGTVSTLSGKQKDHVLFYDFSSFTCPGNIYKLSIDNPLPVLIHETKLPFSTSEFVTDQVFYESKDGTKIPMFIVHHKNMVLNGENPLLLYGYGGFDISLTPTFSASRMLFLKNGGIWVTANIRGGGEFGEKWHQAGTLLNKQNVFDDFIAAAEYLIAKKYTSSSKLAIQGGSNGGLLIGACMTQRPDLFQVAIPQVGVMDMLRYQKFTIGWSWSTDYGTSDNERFFHYLFSYSPLHNIKKGICYPATLVTTGDHDDRVVPAHSFKFISTLQADQACNRPVLIRIEHLAGHGMGKPVSKYIDEATDIWTFIFENMHVPFHSIHFLTKH
ncbi:MAG: prolyl oligopeptidase family serine peptidase [Microbacter sp.]